MSKQRFILSASVPSFRGLLTQLTFRIHFVYIEKATKQNFLFIIQMSDIVFCNKQDTKYSMKYGANLRTVKKQSHLYSITSKTITALLIKQHYPYPPPPN